MRTLISSLGLCLFLGGLVPGWAVDASVSADGTGRADPVARPRVDLWIAESPPGVEVLAAYGRITGSGAPDRLISASAEGVRAVRVHAAGRGPRGGALMNPVDGLRIPARDSVRLSPDGLHLMLMGPVHPLRAGEFLRLRLKFARSGITVVRVPVRRHG
ncbi:MAG: copper chaperone PCu(A)C [Candidatus Sericytochromatia bacterium]|nr:copper chaperone PCu(A)C [Candidatus Sericytochromatia bacterium]